MVLHRYILRQILGPFLAVFFALLALFMVVQLLKLGELTFGAGLAGGDLAWMSLHFLPVFAMWILPIAVLAGILLAMVRLGSDGELVALASAGCSRPRLALMPLLLGAAASIACFGLSVWAAPQAAAELERSLLRMAKQHVIASLRPEQFFEEIPKVVIYPGRAGEGDGSFEGFMLHDRRPGKPRHLLLAKKAKLLPDEGGQGLVLSLEDGQVHARGRRGRYTALSFHRARMGLNVDRLIRDRTRGLPRIDSMATGELYAQARRLENLDSRRLRMAWHRRLAFPWACLIMAWFAVLLAGRLRSRRGTLLAAAGVVLGYYMLMRLGDGLVRPDLVSPWLAAWLPNLLLAGLLGFFSLAAFRRLR